MKNPFTCHPHAVGETYWEHLGFAMKFGCIMAIGGLTAMVHAVFPFLFVTTAGRMNDKLTQMRAQAPGRSKAPEYSI